MQGRQINFPWMHASTRSTLDIFGYRTSMLEPGPDTSRHIQTTIPVARLQRTPSENCSHQGSEYIRIVIVRICSSKISENQGLDHPGIVKCFEWFQTKTSLYLVMELLEGGDLLQNIMQGASFDQDHPLDRVAGGCDECTLCTRVPKV